MLAKKRRCPHCGCPVFSGLWSDYRCWDCGLGRLGMWGDDLDSMLNSAKSWFLYLAASSLMWLIAGTISLMLLAKDPVVTVASVGISFWIRLTLVGVIAGHCAFTVLLPKIVFSSFGALVGFGLGIPSVSTIPPTVLFRSSLLSMALGGVIGLIAANLTLWLVWMVRIKLGLSFYSKKKVRRRQDNEGRPTAGIFYRRMRRDELRLFIRACLRFGYMRMQYSRQETDVSLDADTLCTELFGTREETEEFIKVRRLLFADAYRINVVWTELDTFNPLFDYGRSPTVTFNRKLSLRRHPVVHNAPKGGPMIIESLHLVTGGVQSLLVWRAARGLEAALRCGCGCCVAAQALPFELGDIVLRGFCKDCEQHHKCRVKVTETLEKVATGLAVGDMIEILLDR